MNLNSIVPEETKILRTEFHIFMMSLDHGYNIFDNS
jgi:hypothetical protein